MFPFFHHYPGTDLHEIDLAYILQQIVALTGTTEDIDAWKTTHEAEYAELKNTVDGLVNNLIDVIVPWDSSIAYHIFSIVEYQGTNYIAVQDVPIGTMITNTDYWQPAQTIVEQVNAIAIVTSATQNDVERLNAIIVNVKDYGAVGDGVTDDTAAFNNAIDALQSEMTDAFVFSQTDTKNLGYGFKLYIPAGHYILSDTLTIEAYMYQDDDAATKTYGGVYIEGTGEIATILDFIDARANSDGLVCNCAFSNISNLRIRKAKNHGLVIGENAWGFDINNVVVDEAANAGFDIKAHTFHSIIRHCMALHSNTGFYIEGFSTSLIINGCYANGCTDYGYRFGTAGCVYSSMISCACDNSKYPYFFEKSAQVSMIGCGNEGATPGNGYASITCINDVHLSIMGHYDYNSSGFFLYMGNRGNTVSAYNCFVTSPGVSNTNTLIASEDNCENSFIADNLQVLAQNRTLSQGGGGVNETHTSGYKGNLDSNGAITIGALSSIDGNVSLQGELTIRVFFTGGGARLNGNCGIYKILVAGTSGAYQLSLLGEAGLVSANSASWPGFVFSVDSSANLIATHKLAAQAADRNFTFVINFSGNCKI